LGGNGRCRSNDGPGVVRSLLGNRVDRCLVIVLVDTVAVWDIVSATGHWTARPGPALYCRAL
jgi:hypothetical protein